jgi:hypothetical protein
MLGRNVLVAELAHQLERSVEDAVRVGGEHRVRGGARDLRAAVELGLDLPREAVRIDSELLEYRHDDSLALSEKSEEQVVGRELGATASPGIPLGRLNRFLGFDGELVETHASHPLAPRL